MNNNLFLLHITMGHMQKCSMASATTHRHSAGLGLGHMEKMVHGDASYKIQSWSRWKKKKKPTNLIIGGVTEVLSTE